ncbi:hypothetical protein ACFL2J_06310 [Candidatus Omnitrophota bacterium]
MFIDLACRIKVSLGSFKFSIGDPLSWAGAVFTVILLWRWWGLKKLLSFSIIVALLMFLMFKLDNFILNSLNKEGIGYTFLTKPFFISILICVFLYYGFIHNGK